LYSETYLIIVNRAHLPSKRYPRHREQVDQSLKMNVSK